MTCLVAGDSIAQGLGSVLQECRTNARIGISSTAVISRAGPADVAVISAGSNDPENPNLESNLRAIRARCTGIVIWVLPIYPRARALVIKVAAENSDLHLTFAPAKDNVHPRSYGPMAEQVRNVIRSLSLDRPS